ncbi:MULTISPECIES: SIR2 family protein [Kosakonia]|uniref:SIR2 family protein n=1 Tax=Kosakonia TaxID=1330547 RepID=UPI0005EF73DA|nr:MULTISPECIES: SIR2 family protein [Kosakonia]RCW99897.1 SIR2-like protein [Kosakonia sp. AG348]
MIEKRVMDEKLLIKKRSVKDLADYIRIRSGVSPNYSLFLGAGASVTSGIQTAHQLVQEWRKEIFCRLSHEPYTTETKAREWLADKHPDWYDQNNEYSSLFEKKFDLPSQRRRFVELQVDKKLPSIGYAYLVELFESNFFDTIFTTNFDDLINEAFYQFSSDRPLLCAHDSSINGISVTSSRPKIIKLHGDYLFDSIKSSLKETESLEINTREKLIEFTKEYGLIFVGYAGNDNSIMEVLKYLLKQNDYLRNGIYWCKRKEDQVTPELFKLLSQDKVYWVEIDGFDELMAELTHHLGTELSLGGNQKSTKRERMINNFIKDDYNLISNEFIKKDLAKIKKHTLTRDISSLINELSQSDTDDQRIPEEDFKNLLFIDNLIRTKNYISAEDKLNKLIIDTNDDNIKSKYLRRLIEIKEDQNDTKSALEYSDKLIELDEFNLNYNLARSNIFPDIKDKIDYLEGLLDKFKYSINLKNHLCRVSLSYLNISDENTISFDRIHELADNSLKLNNGLDNRAWRIKYDAIKFEHAHNFNKEERDKAINELINKLKAINPIHDTYLSIYADFSSSSRKKENIKSSIDYLSEVYRNSSRTKKKYILKYLTQLHLSLFEVDDDDDTSKIMKDFIVKYEEDKYESAIAPFILFKARYEIGCNKNINGGITLAKEAMDSPWRNNHIESIADILLAEPENIQVVEDFLDSLPRDVSEVTILKIKSDICNLRKEFDRSIEFLNEARKKKWDLGSYILAKSYTFLLKEEYEKAIEITNENIDKIKDYREKDILTINRETAKKKLGIDLKKNEIHSILAHQRSKGYISMCAFYLLDDHKRGNALLHELLEKDFMYYYRFSQWPALPDNVIAEYRKTKLANNKAA